MEKHENWVSYFEYFVNSRTKENSQQIQEKDQQISELMQEGQRPLQDNSEILYE